MPRFSSTLLKLPQGFIRRFHGTSAKNAEQIQREGLKVNPPNRSHADWLTNLPGYEGVYTTVNPVLGYFDPTFEDDALVILDLPKPWYKDAIRSAVNPELPAPPPKLKRWDERGLRDASIEYNNSDGGLTNRYNLPEGCDDSPTAILEDYRSIVPIQQGGRVDIFKQDIPPEFIKEIIIPKGPPPDHTAFKTLIDPDRNLSWDNVIFGDYY